MDNNVKIQLSPSVEDYLKGIYTITERGGTASTSALAQAIGVQPASITGMIKRLANLGYVEHIPYKGVQLTKNGSAEALRVIRRHRILETYLQEQLGYTWTEVHQEAELLEHTVSNKLISRMARVLNNPTHDPHGAPIPTASGDIPKAHFLTLLDVEPNDLIRIEEVQDEDPVRLQYLEESGLTPGVLVKIMKRNSFDQMTTVTVLGSEIPTAVSRELARDVFVSKIQE